MRFDEESKALYDAVAPVHADEEFLRVLAQLEQRLPGDGPLQARYEAFRSRFVVPPARLDATFRAAIDGCRARTMKHVRLPQGESFSVEYVKGKSWAAYNWYKGDYRSVIQVNTDLPIHADTVIVLACHEGYPGHHVNNVLLEKNFVRDRSWHELTVYPLFSPQSLIAEGTADFGVRVAFPGPERLEFARNVIFPSAGLDPSTASGYYEVLDLMRTLGYAKVEAARRYLDGHRDAAATASWLRTYGLQSSERAEQQIRFFDQYRSYIINYTAGEDLVERRVESRGGTSWTPSAAGELFEGLIAAPVLPSSLTTSNAQLPNVQRQRVMRIFFLGVGSWRLEVDLHRNRFTGFARRAPASRAPGPRTGRRGSADPCRCRRRQSTGRHAAAGPLPTAARCQRRARARGGRRHRPQSVKGLPSGALATSVCALVAGGGYATRAWPRPGSVFPFPSHSIW